MKKLLVLSLFLSMTAGLSVMADEPDTYTGQFLQKHTQKIIDAEKDFKARQDAYAQEQQQRQDAINQRVEELQQRGAEERQQINQQMENFTKTIDEAQQQRQEEMNKKIEAIQQQREEQKQE